MIHNGSSLTGLDNEAVISSGKHDHESGDAFLIRRKCSRPIISMRRCCPGSGSGHCLLNSFGSAVNRAGVIPHRIHARIYRSIVVRDAIQLVEDDIPLGLTVVIVSILRECVADYDVLRRFILSIIDQQQPVNRTMCFIMCLCIRINGSCCKPNSGGMEAAVLVTLYRFGKVQLVTDNNRNLIMIRDPYEFESIRVIRICRQSVINARFLNSGIFIMARGVNKGFTEDISGSAFIDSEGITVGVALRMVSIDLRRKIYVVPDLGFSFIVR